MSSREASDEGSGVAEPAARRLCTKRHTLTTDESSPPPDASLRLSMTTVPSQQRVLFELEVAVDGRQHHFVRGRINGGHA